MMEKEKKKKEKRKKKKKKKGFPKKLGPLSQLGH
jgi:hypothetical protein